MNSNQISCAQPSTTHGNNGRVRSVTQMIRAGVELLAHDIEAGHPEVLTECLKAIARFSGFHSAIFFSFPRKDPLPVRLPASKDGTNWGAKSDEGKRAS